MFRILGLEVQGFGGSGVEWTFYRMIDCIAGIVEIQIVAACATTKIIPSLPPPPPPASMWILVTALIP